MDERTRKALEGSITKWEAIVDGTGVDRGSGNCPLCQEFLDGPGTTLSTECVGCPVAQNTGQKHCEGTPYRDWWHYTAGVAYPDEKALAFAQAEVDYLKSLLPPPKAA
jgi:hypothetical protein